MRRSLAAATIGVVLALPAGGVAEEERPGDFLTNRPALVYEAPASTARIVGRIPPDTIVRVTEIQDPWYRVRSSAGKPDGFIRRSYADPFDGRPRSRRVAPDGEARRVRYRMVSPAYVRSAPDLDSQRLGTVSEGTAVTVIGREGNWLRIEGTGASTPGGFIPIVAASRDE